MHRRGTAAVEFVMVLPLLLLLVVGLIWTGRMSIAWATTAVQARHDAWNARHRVRHGPLDFADTTSGIATAPSERTVAVANPAVSASARDSATVHGDPWGYRTLDMNKPPDWPLMAAALRQAGANRGEQIDATVDRISDVSASLVSIKGVLPSLESVISRFTADIDGAKQEFQKELLAKVGGDVTQAITEARTNITKLENELIPQLEQMVKDTPDGVDAVVKTQLTQARAMLEAYKLALETLEQQQTAPSP